MPRRAFLGAWPVTSVPIRFILSAIALWAMAGSCTDRFSAPPADGPNGGTPGAGGGEGSHPRISLISAAPSTNEGLVAWRTEDLGATPPNAALFVGTDAATLFAQPAIPVTLSLGQRLITGLTENVTYHVGMGVETSPGQYAQVGPTLRMRADMVIYANIDTPASFDDQDGLTPETAFFDPAIAVAIAQAFGGGNVWIAEGSYPAVSITMIDGVDIYGGFEPTFDLRLRNAPRQDTVLVGPANEDVLIFNKGLVPITIDSVTIDGSAGVENGVIVNTRPLELRSMVLSGCGRGVKLRSSDNANPAQVTVIGCDINQSRVEGLSLIGAFDLAVYATIFSDNKNEGLDTGPASAPSFEIIDISIVDCEFRGNGAEGLDLTLSAPSTPTGTGGSFNIRVEDCDFIGNVLSGMLVDIDFELDPTWEASIHIRGCYAAANGADGIHLDIDSRSDTLIQRCNLTTNAANGLRVTSESYRELVTLSASALTGNLSAGARASLGNVPLLVSHCVVAGNAAGGIVQGVVRGSATSTAGHLQSKAFQGITPHFSLDLDSSTLPFSNAPIQYLTATKLTGNEVITATAPDFGSGSVCELSDDGVAYLSQSVTSASVFLDPAPTSIPIPTRLRAFPPASPVLEDYIPSPASPLLGAGMSFPGFPAEDCGPFGSTHPGPPGSEDLVSARPFYLAHTVPAYGSALGSGQVLTLQFSGGLAPANIPAGAIRVTQGTTGIDVPVDLAVTNGQIQVSPPIGGWQSGMVVELHRRLTSASGDLLIAPVALPIQ